jgi:hypothetical protein
MVFSVVEEEKKNIEPRDNTNKFVCKCPWCGSDVYEKGKVIACENSGKDEKGNKKDCSFVWFKNNKWWNNKGIDVSPNLVKLFAEKGETQLFNGLQSTKNKNKIYSANITVSPAPPNDPYQSVKLDMTFVK